MAKANTQGETLAQQRQREFTERLNSKINQNKPSQPTTQDSKIVTTGIRERIIGIKPVQLKAPPKLL